MYFCPSTYTNGRAHFLSGFWKFYKIHDGLTNEQSDVCINFCLKNKTDTSKVMSVSKCTVIQFWVYTSGKTKKEIAVLKGYLNYLDN